MAQNAKTRKANEKVRVIKLVGNVCHQIVGAKLPSIRQVLQVFFHNMRYVKLACRKSAALAIDAVLIFWNQARIPTRDHPRCIDYLLKIYNEWKSHQKRNVYKMSNEIKLKYDNFVGNLDNLFDIAHADAMIMIRKEEDKAFLEQQRQTGRPGSMLGVDQNLAEREERSRLRKEQAELRKKNHTQAQASTSAAQQSREFIE